MKTVLAILFILLSVVAQAVTYQEFYVRTTGSNLNSGSTDTDAATVTFNRGNWDSSTGVYTPESGTTAGATVGAFASIYLTGASQTDFVGRITAVTSTNITVSLTAKSGTIPPSTSGDIRMKVGGAWAGMSGTNAFPFEWYSADMADVDANTNRINFKGSYSITSSIEHTLDGATIFQGYTTTAGDGGKATITGPGTGSYFNLIKFNAGPDDTDSTIADFIIENNGDTGSTTNTHGLWINSGGCNALRVLVRNIGGHGILHQGRGVLVSCEAYNCNLANNANQAGIAFASSGSYAWYCFSHHNLGSNTDGFRLGSSSHVAHCISWANGRHGYNITAGDVRSILQCDAFANGGDGISMVNTVTGALVIENTNIIDNVGSAIDLNSGIIAGMISNIGLGSGTAANGAGIVEVVAAEIVGTVTYPSNSIPWSGATTGNFTIDLAEAKNAGRGVFLQSDGGTTLGTPDIGAAFALDSGGGGGDTSATTVNGTATNITITR